MKKLLNGISITTVFFMVLGLSGCNDPSAVDEARSVEWYQVNKAERKAKLAACMSRLDNSDAEPDCINASRAENNSEADTHWLGGEKEVRTPASVYD